jgi:hypothetical protein
MGGANITRAARHNNLLLAWRQEIDDRLWGKIARQLRVRGKYLREMIDCTKSREDYYKQVTDEPYPPWTHRF